MNTPDDMRIRYSELFDHAPAGYCVVSGAGRILLANARARALLGTPRNPPDQPVMTRFVFSDDQHLYDRLLEQAAAGAEAPASNSDRDVFIRNQISGR